MIRTLQVGYHSHHSDDFRVHIGEGRYWLIINTLSPAEFYVNGRWIACRNNQIIIYPPGVYVDYRAHDSEYGDNYTLLVTNEDFIVNTSCPLGRPITIQSQFIFDYIFHMLLIDNHYDSKNKTDNMMMLYKLLFNKVDELCANPDTMGYKDISNSYLADLNLLNTNIIENPSYNWTVEHMATQLNLCKGYFQKIYKKQFGVSCMEFVYHSRIELAKRYLSISKYRIKDIATICGYNNYEHFSRHFKRFTNLSPQEYRTTYQKQVSYPYTHEQEHLP